MTLDVMTELVYDVKEWCEDRRRHVMLRVDMLVKPYVRQTRTTRWATDKDGVPTMAALRAQAYNENQAAIRDAVTVMMIKADLPPFGKVKLGFEASFWMCRKEVFGRKRKTWEDDPAKCDLNNLEKAIEDALKGPFYPDDVWIWKRGEGVKMASDEDRFVVHVWELSDSELYVDWDDLWPKLAIPGDSHH